jgi:hypothetical protein
MVEDGYDFVFYVDHPQMVCEVVCGLDLDTGNELEVRRREGGFQLDAVVSKDLRFFEVIGKKRLQRSSHPFELYRLREAGTRGCDVDHDMYACCQINRAFQYVIFVRSLPLQQLGSQAFFYRFPRHRSFYLTHRVKDVLVCASKHMLAAIDQGKMALPGVVPEERI